MKLKSLGYVLLFLGLLATELIKDADASTKEQRDLCVAFGDAAYQIAVNRDQGHSIYETRNRVIRNFDPRVRDAILAIVDIVYKRPWHSPESEANLLVGNCMNRFEEEVKKGSTW